MPIRLVAVNHTTLLAGAERNLGDLLSRLPLNEVQVLTVVAPGNGPAVAAWAKQGVRCIDLPVPHFAGLRSPVLLVREFQKWRRFQRLFTKYLERESPDLIYANSPHAAIASEPVLTRAHLPLVWQIPDLIKDKPLNRLLLQRVFCASRAIIAVSRATADSVVKLGADRLRVHIAHCGVDVAKFDFAARTAGAFRAELGLSAAVEVVGMFGQITHWKGWHVLVEAVPLVVRLFANTRFVFVGRTMVKSDVTYIARLKARLLNLGVDQYVTWTGYREDVDRVMTDCDVIVHASVQPEPLGSIALEGMAACKPVICTEGGGIKEAVQDQETGLVTPPNDPVALANAINRLLANPALRAQMGTKGRQAVEARFTHERRVQTFVDVFRQIVAVSRETDTYSGGDRRMI